MPNFFIVGAARSGTTSLDRYLSQHPQIYIAPWKEVHFFAAEHFPPRFTGPGDERVNRRLIREEEEYTQLFAGVSSQQAIGESSAFYLCLPGTAERIAARVPNAKILILLREPVARAYSAYMHLVRDGRETLDFVQGLTQEQVRKEQGFEPIWWYKELSLYARQVQRYLEVFGRQQVKVLLSEDFYAHPAQTLREVFAFLGVQEDVTIDTSSRYNTAGVPRSRGLYTLLHNVVHQPNPLVKGIKSLVPSHLRQVWANNAMNMLLRPVPMNPQIQEQFKGHFAEDVAQLEEILQRDLLCWHYREPSLAQKA